MAAELVLALQSSRNGYAAEFSGVYLVLDGKEVNLAYGLDLQELREVVKAEGKLFELEVRLDG